MKDLDFGKDLIRKKIPLVSNSPGVYRMLDKKNQVLYVGKAKNLPNRLKSYATDKNQTIRIERMLALTNSLEIVTTRDIARQMLRHRSFSFQEFSQRYANPVKDLEFTIREARLQDPNNRQNSIENDDEEISKLWKEKQENLITEAKNAYNWAIENGIAKEQARSVLPEGNTVSRLYMNGTLRSWIHYIELRSDNGTQKEHMEIALACAEVINEIFPMGKNLN